MRTLLIIVVGAVCIAWAGQRGIKAGYEKGLAECALNQTPKNPGE